MCIRIYVYAYIHIYIYIYIHTYTYTSARDFGPKERDSFQLFILLQDPITNITNVDPITRG